VFEQFYNTHRPHQGIANDRPLHPLPVLCRLLIRTRSPASTYDNATTSAASSTSTNMRPELGGSGYRQGQRGHSGSTTSGAPAPPIT
jgi:hypothetical protein